MFVPAADPIWEESLLTRFLGCHLKHLCQFCNTSVPGGKVVSASKQYLNLHPVASQIFGHRTCNWVCSGPAFGLACNKVRTLVSSHSMLQCDEMYMECTKMSTASHVQFLLVVSQATGGCSKHTRGTTDDVFGSNVGNVARTANVRCERWEARKLLDSATWQLKRKLRANNLH